jgi:hypothetical protein
MGKVGRDLSNNRVAHTEFTLVYPYFEIFRTFKIEGCNSHLRMAISRNKALLDPYATSPYANIITSFKRRRFLAASVSACTILGDFLPLLLSNVPFDRNLTWMASYVSTWITVAMLGVMLCVLVGLTVILVRRSPETFIDLRILEACPIAVALVLASQSTDVASLARGLRSS